MGESTLPELEDFDIQKPGYIRKLDSRSRWHPEGCETLEDRAKAVVQRIFANPKHIYSLWFVENKDQFYGVVAELSAGRSSKNKNLDFLWIDAAELVAAAVDLTQKTEGKCLLVCDLHFDARIDLTSANALCLLMIQAGRNAQRCKKKHTTEILSSQKKKGCKTTETSREQCKCEESSV